MSETAKFTEDILGAAKRKAQAILAEAESETKKSLEEARTHSTREAEAIVASARAEAEGVKRRQLSEARHRVKLIEQQEKSKILSEVLQLGRSRVLEVTKNDSKYVPFLTGLMEAGIREIGLDAVVVHTNAADMKRIDKAKIERDLLKKLERPVKIEWAKEHIESSGGATISSPDGRTRIVSTLNERFDALEAKLLVEAGRILFGE